MPKNRRSFSPEYKDEAAKMVVELSRPVATVARELGLNEQSLRNWVNAYRKTHADEEPPLTLPERARLRNLRKKAANSGSKKGGLQG